MALATTFMLKPATLDAPDVHLTKVRVVINPTEAYAIDGRGARVWEAQLSGVERQGRKVALLTLSDPPGTVVRVEQTCGCRK